MTCEIFYGPYLRRFRDSKGKTLRETARHLQCSAAFLSDVELSRRGPLAKNLMENLLEFLEASEIEYLALRGLARLERLDQAMERVRKL